MEDPPALRISDLEFRYDGRNGGGWSLRVDGVELGRGEQLLLTGGSGTGKSTLLHLVCGLMDPQRGRVEVDGTAIHDLRGARRDLHRGRSIGMIFQSFNLLAGFTALENVMIAMMFADPVRLPRAGHRSRAAELLHHLGIDEPRRMPDQLSIGQQQRVAVARAVACEPILVLADEPTASLDPDNAAIALELIQRTCREHEAALLCVSHDPSIVELFERRLSIGELASTAPEPEASSWR